MSDSNSDERNMRMLLVRTLQAMNERMDLLDRLSRTLFHANARATSALMACVPKEQRKRLLWLLEAQIDLSRAEGEVDVAGLLTALYGGVAEAFDVDEDPDIASVWTAMQLKMEAAMFEGVAPEQLQAQRKWLDMATDDEYQSEMQQVWGTQGDEPASSGTDAATPAPSHGPSVKAGLEARAASGVAKKGRAKKARQPHPNSAKEEKDDDVGSGT